MIRPLIVTALILVTVFSMIFYGIPTPLYLGVVGAVLTIAGVAAAIKISRWWFTPATASLSFFWLLYARLTFFC